MPKEKSDIKPMTREEWNDVLRAMLLLPIRARTRVWSKAFEFLSKLVQGKLKRELVQSLKAEGLYYSVDCSLCKKPIRLGQSFVFHAGDGSYNHYDCHMGE